MGTRKVDRARDHLVPGLGTQAGHRQINSNTTAVHRDRVRGAGVAGEGLLELLLVGAPVGVGPFGHLAHDRVGGGVLGGGVPAAHPRFTRPAILPGGHQPAWCPWVVS